MPACLSIRQAVLDHHAHGEFADALCISGFGCGDIIMLGIEDLAAMLAAVLRIGDADVARLIELWISQIMDGSLHNFMTRSFSSAAWTRSVAEVTGALDDLRRREVFCGGRVVIDILTVFSWLWHGYLPKDSRYYQLLTYRKQ